MPLSIFRLSFLPKGNRSFGGIASKGPWACIEHFSFLKNMLPHVSEDWKRISHAPPPGCLARVVYGEASICVPTPSWMSGWAGRPMRQAETPKSVAKCPGPALVSNEWSWLLQSWWVRHPYFSHRYAMVWGGEGRLPLPEGSSWHIWLWLDGVNWHNATGHNPMLCVLAENVLCDRMLVWNSYLLFELWHHSHLP